MIKSPRLAAIGVATLSGLMRKYRDTIIMTIINTPRTPLAKLAVNKEAAAISRKCIKSTIPSKIQFSVTAKHEASAAMTSA